MTPDTSQSQSLGGLLHSLRDETVTLLRQEAALAKAEVRRNINDLGAHLAQIAVGGLVTYAGAIVLLIGLGHLLEALLIRAGMSVTLSEWLAPSIVGVVVALIGWGMLAKAKKSIAGDDLAPKQTLETMKENKQWAETKLHTST